MCSHAIVSRGHHISKAAALIESTVHNSEKRRTSCRKPLESDKLVCIQNLTAIQIALKSKQHPITSISAPKLFFVYTTTQGPKIKTLKIKCTCGLQNGLQTCTVRVLAVASYFIPVLVGFTLRPLFIQYRRFCTLPGQRRSSNHRRAEVHILGTGTGIYTVPYQVPGTMRC